MFSDDYGHTVNAMVFTFWKRFLSWIYKSEIFPVWEKEASRYKTHIRCTKQQQQKDLAILLNIPITPQRRGEVVSLLI